MHHYNKVSKILVISSYHRNLWFCSLIIFTKSSIFIFSLKQSSVNLNVQRTYYYSLVRSCQLMLQNPLGWGCRKSSTASQQKGKTTLNEFMRLNNLMVMIEYWRMRSIPLSYLPNTSARTGYDTRSIFKWSLTGLNSEFSFS